MEAGEEEGQEGGNPGGEVEVKDWFTSYVHAKGHAEVQEEIVTSRLEENFKPGTTRWMLVRD